MAEKKCTITHMPHHVQQKLCQARPPYRQGKRLTAVKVYTINDESQHLLICGVPKIKLGEEVKKLIYPYGDVKAIQLVTEYPSEEFTETYHIHYARIQSARIAKRFIDNKNFFGGLLHVFYVPELETLPETKAKLAQRRKDVITRIKRNQADTSNPEVDKFVPTKQYHRKKKTPALPLTQERVQYCYPEETLSSICNGIPQNIDPRPISEPSLPVDWYSSYSNNQTGEASLSAPYRPTEAVIEAGSSRSSGSPNVRKRNYKGQLVSDNVKVKVTRPRLIDTRNIARLNSTEKTDVFCNVKKVDSGITVKLLERPDNERKKIVIKNPNVTHLIQPSEDLQHSIKMAKSHIRAAMQKIFQ
ncbi:PREDICTED: RNA-binding protein 48 isoform X2 [Dinoponera quadriceps]|nr:PREDICTED: RNA-binding protein 48 isoform X2 [Dinoponera quadriceps]XP_014479638.1 PREDICTED: RNA-binding protein 48 isoform X2 [Dinoponera quadriceps]XP_014479639.1 PREDICTED: RNA-binding protein 48 isoform X2 [Dinoponera quadriceps]